MHRCLYISEIARMICGHLRQMAQIHEMRTDDISEVYEARYTLAGLARTCKALKDPALDSLWADLDSLYPLLACLPLDIQRRTDGSIHTSRPLEPSDFVIFQSYAKRVRMLGYRQRNPFMSADLLRLLSSFPYTPGSALLPSLRVLSWPADSDETFPFIRFFLPPTLLCLNFPGDAWPSCKQIFMSFLHIHCPQLQEFSCAEPPPHVVDRISDFIIKAENLASIDCGPPNAKAMKHFMSRSSLRYLTIDIPEHDHYDRVEGTLASVETFNLRAQKLDQAVNFMEKIKLTPVSATIILGDVAPGTFVRIFFDQLSKSLKHDKLEILKYSIEGIVDNPRANQYLYELEANTFEPLFVFKNLVIVRLENFRMPFFDDVMAERLADAWPQLEVLKLGTGQDWQTDTCTLRRSLLTLYGVGYIAAHCKKLHTLGLVFDSTQECELLKADWTNENIRVLDVGASPIDNPVPIAAALLFLLPRVKEIWAKPPLKNLSSGIGMMPMVDRRAERWTLVLEMVTVFGTVRDDAIADAKAETRKDVLQELAKQGFFTTVRITRGQREPPEKTRV
ncbi:hypothetical protein V8B97DRAFT_1874465 [Scleroderma yunnanense]